MLLAGVPAFLAERLREVFEKEDWIVLTLEEDISSEKTSDFFAAKLPTALIYRLEPDRDDCISRLDRLLSHAMKANVSRILLLEEPGVFAPGVRAGEDSKTEPLNRKGRRLCRLESLASIWRTNEKLSITLVRLPALYGPDQKPGDDFLGSLLNHILCGEKESVLTTAPQSFLSSRDTAYGLLQCALRGKDLKTIHLGPGTSFSWDEFEALAGPLLPEGKKLPETVRLERVPEAEIDRHLIYGNAILDGTLARNELGWFSRADDREGLKAAITGIRDAWTREQADAQKLQKENEMKERLNRLIPYGENIAGFIIMAIVLAVRLFAGSRSPFDFNYLYIGAMGLLYGKQQSFIACFLSMILLLVQMLAIGRDPVAILYDPMSFLHFVSYFFVAVLSGYFADRETYEKAAAQWREERDRTQISFLRNLFEESLQIRDKLYRQVVNSEDSIGHVYRIVQQLDSIEEEQLYTKTATVTAELLGVTDVAVYVLGKNSHFMRRKVRLGPRAAARPASVDIEKHPYLINLIRTGKVFMNREFLDDTPDLAAPVLTDGKVTAVIAIYGLSFSQWSYHEENMISLTARLIAAALSRAAAWEETQMAERYLPETRILRAEPFAQIIENLRIRRQELHDAPSQLLVINGQGLTAAEMNEKLSSCVRNEDFIGQYKDGYAALFPDTPEKVLPIIEGRFAKAGLSIIRKEEVM